MKYHKNGIFFTFISITIMTIFILVFTPQSDVSLQKDLESTRTRVNSVNNYVNDVENRYFEAVLRVSGFAAIESLALYMNKTGLYLTDLDAAFYEVILNGTINNVPIDPITGEKLMEDNTLVNWSNKIIDAGRDTLNVNTTIIINNASASQTTPWDIDLSLSLNLTVKSGTADWKNVEAVTATFGIEGLDDPYYLINTLGEYRNLVSMSNIEFNKWNITHVREHIRNGTYVHFQNSIAPSFLMRFTNTISNSSCCGIESFVNPNLISPSDRIDSYLDYMLWSPINDLPCEQIYNITNPPGSEGLWDEFRHFKLDTNHTLLYNITDVDAKKACP
ncbi:MAG: hypothetical protein AABX33_02240 [Nanoarchaeota archaeon]